MSERSLEAPQKRIARLEGRIAALEDALDRRSRELRLLQTTLSPADLVQLARLADGLAALPRIAHQPEYWSESTVIAPADLESTLEDLWLSLTPSPIAAAAVPRFAPSPWPGPAADQQEQSGAESSE
ncbi:MAG: hypothetical protein ABI689_16910 [Thermoanaerobaculia bacterium]